METLGSRLQLALDARKKSSADVARAANITEAAISQWLNGKTKNVRAANLLTVATFLRCNPQWLADGVGASGLDDDAPVTTAPAAHAPSDVRDLLWQLAGKIGSLNPEMRRSIATSLQSMALDPDNASLYIESLAPLLGGGQASQATDVRKRA